MKKETKSNEEYKDRIKEVVEFHSGDEHLFDDIIFQVILLLAEREAEVKKRLFEIAETNAWLYDEEHEDMVLYLNDIPPIIEMALSTNTPK